MFETFRNRNFSLLWLAGLISLMGNWMLITAVPFHVYAVTGSALATSAWLMAYIAPGVLFSSVAGVFVDRWDRRKTMIIVNVLQMLTIPLLLLIQSPEWIWVVYVVGFIESTLSHFFSPAESALLPTLVPEEQLVSANSLNALNDNLARIVGPAVGGLLLGIWGLGSVVLADAVSYGLAALLIVLVAVPAREEKIAAETAVGQQARSRFAQVWQEWLSGLQLVVRDRVLSSTFLVIGIALFGDAILSAIMVVFFQDDVGLTASQFGTILTARGVGGFIGGLLIAQLGQKFSNRQLISAGLVISGALVLAILFKPSLTLILLLIALVGIPAIAWMVAIQTVLQQATADEYRGRIFGAFGTTSTLLMLIGSGLAGILADGLGATALMAAAGVIYLFSGLLAWPLFSQPAPEMAAVGVSE